MAKKRYCEVDGCGAFTNLTLAEAAEMRWIAFAIPANAKAKPYCPKHNLEGRKAMEAILTEARDGKEALNGR